MITRPQAILEFERLKELLVQSHRDEDWERAKQISAKRSQLRRLIAKRPVCIDCGVRIEKGRRCQMHDQLSRGLKKILWALVMFLTVSVLAGPGTVKTNVTLVADYDTNIVSADLSFNLYSSTNIAAPLSTWSVVTNVAYPACMVNATNVMIVLPIMPGNHYYFLTTSNYFGESDPSNVAIATVVARGTNLRITPGP